MITVCLCYADHSCSGPMPPSPSPAAATSLAVLCRETAVAVRETKEAPDDETAARTTTEMPFAGKMVLPIRGGQRPWRPIWSQDKPARQAYAGLAIDFTHTTRRLSQTTSNLDGQFHSVLLFLLVTAVALSLGPKSMARTLLSPAV